jgi:hypothetical protein
MIAGTHFSTIIDYTTLISRQPNKDTGGRCHNDVIDGSLVNPIAFETHLPGVLCKMASAAIESMIVEDKSEPEKPVDR